MQERAGSALDPPGYTWQGDLAQVQINTIYAACHSLRFTGLVDLRDSHHQAQVTFLGGDPVEIEGGDTKMISLWNEGQFRAAQSMPNLSGELTGQIEQTGSLAITKAPRLLAWVSEYRLTCDLTIERPGEKALMFFKNGQLESAEVNGKPELSALARVQGWTDGFYRVRLRPLFEAGFVTHSPPPSELHLPAAGQFDVSRSIPLDLKQKARLQSPELDQAPEQSIAPPRATAGEQPRGMPRLSSGTDPVLRSEERLPPPSRAAAKSRWPIWLALVLVLTGGGGAAAYLLHLPPFSAPPRPLDEPRVVAPSIPRPAAPAQEAPKQEAPQQDPIVAPKQEREPQPEPAPEPTRSKSVDDAKLEPHPTDEGPSGLPAVAPLDVRLIEKGRQLLIDGHAHSAMSLFRKAEQANPKNALAKVLQQQALGKLGRADLIIEGKGSITIDGKSFSPPKKLHVMAGPHAVSTSAGEEEVTLKKGERRHLRARP